MVLMSVWMVMATASAQEPAVELVLPTLGVTDIPMTVGLRPSGLSPDDTVAFRLQIIDESGRAVESGNGALVGTQLSEVSGIVAPGAGTYRVQVLAGGIQAQAPLRVIPGFFTILPPLIAIATALVFRQVLVALFAGGWLGAFLLAGYDPFMAVLRHADTLILGSITSPWNASVLLVIIILGGMIGIISVNGSVYGVVDLVTGWAKTPRSGQLATWVMGLIIFFEGFVNTLVVGNTMRPVTDRLRISREKLSFIVDATAAPVASIALISGWIGFEVGLIGDALRTVHLDYNPYQTFVETIPYRFYPILMLMFIVFVAWQRRDFGPMYTAERRARTTGKVFSDSAVPLTGDESALQPAGGRSTHWFHALFPLLIVIGVTFWGMWYTGVQSLESSGQNTAASLWTIFGQGNGSIALLWGSMAGCLVAVGGTVGFGLLRLSACLDAWFEGVKSILLAIVILVLAWALVAACRDLRTADYIVGLTTGVLSPHLLPALTFIVAALVSFATGTSWGTMALVMPLVVPLAVGLSAETGITGDSAHIILLGAISSVLSGAVWGDHCSPISDTTIMSSMASGADHIDHVRTQMPYALVVGGVGVLAGDLPTAYGLSPWISLAVGAGVLLLILRLIGKKTDEPEEKEGLS